MCLFNNGTNLCQCQHKNVSFVTIDVVMKMETNEIIRGLREDRDLTQQYMADVLKIGRTMYRRYETGETEIPIRHLKSLCLFFGVSSDYLLGLPSNLQRGRNSKTKRK